MLNKDVLNQLKNIKQEIRSGKDLHKATVRGTQWKYGFARLEDGRDILLPHEEMQKVYPDDEVEVNILSNDRNRPYAVIEKVFKSHLKYVVGRIIFKKQHCFLNVDVTGIQQLLFIAPPFRNNAENGDVVFAKISKHPYFSEGKAQAKVLEIFDQQSPSFKLDYIQKKFYLPENTIDEATEKSLQEALESALQDDTRTDLSDKAFVTIDAATARDLDDALLVEKQDKGFVLHVAIADPNAILAQQKGILQHAKKMSSSIYFPKHQQSMLPELVAHDLCSLQVNQKRPAMVCSITCDDSGNTTDFNIQEALIESKAKLSYQAVADYIENNNDDAFKELTSDVETIKQQVKLLAEFFETAKSHLSSRNIKTDDKEFRLNINDEYKVTSVDVSQKSVAHQIVELAMVLCNNSVAQWAKQNNIAPFLFNTHKGFRDTQLTLIKQFLNARQHQQADADLSQFDQFSLLMQSVKNADETLKEKYSTSYDILSNQMTRSEISLEAAPHYGLALNEYTSFTSPLRRYQDLFNHQQIKLFLKSEKQLTFKEQNIQDLQQNLERNRFAQNQMHNWLLCEYLQAKKKEVFSATVQQLQGNYVNIRVDELGVIGRLDMRPLKEYKFDGTNKCFAKDDEFLKLGQSIKVKLNTIDWNKYTPIFSLQNK